MDDGDSDGNQVSGGRPGSGDAEGRRVVAGQDISHSIAYVHLVRTNRLIAGRKQTLGNDCRAGSHLHIFDGKDKRFAERQSSYKKQSKLAVLSLVLWLGVHFNEDHLKSLN